MFKIHLLYKKKKILINTYVNNYFIINIKKIKKKIYIIVD